MKEYISTYIYRVPFNNQKEFKRIQLESSKIYEEYGAISDITYIGISLDNKYGCTGISTTVPTSKDEIIYFSITKFKDKKHHDEVMEKVDKDIKINQLYNEICSLLDVKKIIRGEFSCI